jgi:intracellular multiplication protein IcmW
MPDFSHKAVHEFWREFQDPTIYKVISFMEGVEDWTLDGNAALEQSITKLGETLDDLGNIELKEEASFINLVVNIKTGRGLRVLMALDTAYPGAASKVLLHAEETTKSDSDTAGIFLRRNIVFERLRLLSRVFGTDRFKLVLQSLEEGGYE